MHCKLCQTHNNQCACFFHFLSHTQQHHDQSSASKEAQLGKSHASVGITADRLALLLEKQQQFEEASALYRRVLAIKIQTFGSVHEEIAITLSNLAGCLRLQHKEEEALELW